MMTRSIMRLGCVYILAMFLLIAPAKADSDGHFVMPQYAKKVSLDFKNADLKDVLKAFAAQLEMNFLMTKDVDVKEVTVFLENVPVEEALQQLLFANGLDYEYDQISNILLVKPKAPSADETLVSRVFQLRFANVGSSHIAAFLKQEGNKEFAVAGSGSDSGSSETSSTGEASSGGGEDGDAGLLNILKSVLQHEKAKVVEDSRTNSLIVTDVQGNMSNIERVIARLDVPISQILIEVEMLDVSKGLLDNIGLKYEGSVLKLYPETVTGTIGKDAVYGSLAVGAGANGWTRYGDIFRLWEHGGVIPEMNAVLDFLRTNTSTKSLARPRIMTMDNQMATVKIATDDIVGITTEIDTETNIRTITAERAITGVILSVTPQVNFLSDEVTLAVEPKVVSRGEITSFTTSTSGQNEFWSPEERSVRTILRVKDGETVAIGGLLRTESTDTVTKLPLLGDIPFIGKVFTHKGRDYSERELLVFLTPRIMDSSFSSPADSNPGPATLDREQQSMDPRKKEIDRVMDQAGGR